uniref:Uncharacterized protein n=1 Tax=Ditylum brightwellii TaxID=49249 RepID=A0A7S4RY10_9STRA
MQLFQRDNKRLCLRMRCIVQSKMPAVMDRNDPKQDRFGSTQALEESNAYCKSPEPSLVAASEDADKKMMIPITHYERLVPSLSAPIHPQYLKFNSFAHNCQSKKPTSQILTDRNHPKQDRFESVSGSAQALEEPDAYCKSPELSLVASSVDVDKKMMIPITHYERLVPSLSAPIYTQYLKFNSFAHNCHVQTYSPEESSAIIGAALDVLDCSALCPITKSRDPFNHNHGPSDIFYLEASMREPEECKHNARLEGMVQTSCPKKISEGLHGMKY